MLDQKRSVDRPNADKVKKPGKVLTFSVSATKRT